MITNYNSSKEITIVLNQKKIQLFNLPLPEKDGLGIHSVIQMDGSISFGPNSYLVDEIDYGIDYRYVEDFHRSISKYLDIEIKELYPDYSGIRPRFKANNGSHNDFIISNEESKGFPNLINLIGIESPGLTCSLSIAKYVKEIIEF